MIFDFLKSLFGVQTRLLVYGANGWIGGMYVDYLKKNHPEIKVFIGIARVDREDELEDEISLLYPTNIISFIGRTHGTVNNVKVNSIDYLEYPGKIIENIKDNLYAPVILANICVRRDIHYTYIGTGCIFNNDHTTSNFLESDLPNYFGSNYSIVKGFTDRLMQSFPSNVLNLRISMPISSIPNPRNFITKISKYPKICNMDNSMTVLDDFFPIFTDLLYTRTTGTYNCVNPGVINHNEILSRYRDVINPLLKWENMTLAEQSGILKCERSNNQLNTDKIMMEYPKLQSIDKSINTVLMKMKKELLSDR
jgi:3,5-epimerase/4-reductase